MADYQGLINYLSENYNKEEVKDKTKTDAQRLFLMLDTFSAHEVEELKKEKDDKAKTLSLLFH